MTTSRPAEKGACAETVGRAETVARTKAVGRGAASGRGAAGGESVGRGAVRAQARASAGFDRLRPRGTRPPAVTAKLPAATIGRDVHGKRALYSGLRPVAPPTTSLTVACSRCGETSVIGARRALRVLTPSVHLPLIRPRHPSLLRCPTCCRLSWVRLGLRLHPAS